MLTDLRNCFLSIRSYVDFCDILAVLENCVRPLRGFVLQFLLQCGFCQMGSFLIFFELDTVLFEQFAVLLIKVWIGPFYLYFGPHYPHELVSQFSNVFTITWNKSFACMWLLFLIQLTILDSIRACQQSFVFGQTYETTCRFVRYAVISTVFLAKM